MSIKMNVWVLLFALLLTTELYAAAAVVREASFHRVMDGKDYYTSNSGTKVDMIFHLSAMSDDGKVVAFYSDTYFDYSAHHALFIHDFESTAEPVEVTLPAYVGNFNQNAGLVSNADGTRIFFHARDTVDTNHHLFGMVNGKTGEVTILFRTVETDTQTPQDIGTDAAGDYLYFNQRNDGYGKGNLLRIGAHSGAVPSVVIYAANIPHPSGGTVKFIDGFDVSDDGKTIAFFGLGWDKTDGTSNRFDNELFVKTTGGIRNLTNNIQNSKDDIVISGDASTIVYVGDISGSYSWMVTSPNAAVESQRHIEVGYQSCGNRPGITQDGTLILGTSTLNGVSSCNTYLIRTDGSSRLMIEPGQINIKTTYDGLHLSNDGRRTFFMNSWSIHPDGWYNMTAGVFGENLWSTEVPSVTGVNYPNDMYTKLEENKKFEIKITVSDPQDIIVEDRRVREKTLFPNGYEAKGAAGTVNLYMNNESVSANLYTADGARTSAWPARDPIMTARFSVHDDDFNVGYVDTLIQPPISITPSINYLLLD